MRTAAHVPCCGPVLVFGLRKRWLEAELSPDKYDGILQRYDRIQRAHSSVQIVTVLHRKQSSDAAQVDVDVDVGVDVDAAAAAYRWQHMLCSCFSGTEGQYIQLQVVMLVVSMGQSECRTSPQPGFVGVIATALVAVV